MATRALARQRDRLVSCWRPSPTQTSRGWKSSHPARTEGPPTLQRTEDGFQIFRDVPSIQQLRRQFYKTDETVGFVPTMGALHDGHLNLVRHALRENTRVFVSIFLNPTQFGVNEDLASYPKTFDEDLRKLASIQEEVQAQAIPGPAPGITGIFAPTVKIMYPTLPPSSEINGDGSFVTITPLAKWYEGASRPVFFRGVATVCMKFFHIVQPDNAYFGQKDIQQSVLIKRMVKDFHIPSQIQVIPTSREPNGLAMSSRNVHLGDRRRKDAAVLYKALQTAQELYQSSDPAGLRADVLRRTAYDVFAQQLERRDGSLYGSGKIDIDYVALSEADDMQEIRDGAHLDPSKGAIMSAAIKMHPVENPMRDERAQLPVRLIDNVILAPKPT